MNNRRAAIIASIILIAAVASASAQNVDARIIGFETSVVYGYNVGTQTMGYANSYGIDLTLTDALVAGFVFTSNAGGSLADSFMLNFAYGLGDRLGMNIAVGNAAAAAHVGVGMYYNIFERKVQDTLVSVLKLKVGYDFAPSTGFDTGDILMGLGLVLGM